MTTMNIELTPINCNQMNSEQMLRIDDLMETILSDVSSYGELSSKLHLKDRVPKAEKEDVSVGIPCKVNKKGLYQIRERRIPSCHVIGQQLGIMYGQIKSLANESIRNQLLSDFEIIKPTMDRLIYSVLRLHESYGRHSVGSKGSHRRVLDDLNGTDEFKSTLRKLRFAVSNLNRNQSGCGAINRNATHEGPHSSNKFNMSSTKAMEQFNQALEKMTSTINDFRGALKSVINKELENISNDDKKILSKIEEDLYNLKDIAPLAEPYFDRNEEITYFIKELISQKVECVGRDEFLNVLKSLASELRDIRTDIKENEIMLGSHKPLQNTRTMKKKCMPSIDIVKGDRDPVSLWKKQHVLRKLAKYDMKGKDVFDMEKNREVNELVPDGKIDNAIFGNCNRLYRIIQRTRRREKRERPLWEPKLGKKKDYQDLENILKVNLPVTSGYFEWERHFDRYRLNNECEDLLLEAWCRLRTQRAESQKKSEAPTVVTDKSEEPVKVDEGDSVSQECPCSSPCLCACSTCSSSECEEPSGLACNIDLCCDSRSCVCFKGDSNECNEKCCQSDSCLCFKTQLCNQGECCGSASCTCVQCNADCCQSESCVCFKGDSNECNEKCCQSDSCLCFKTQLCNQGECCGSASCTCVQCNADCCQSESCVCFTEKKTGESCKECCDSDSCICVTQKTSCLIDCCQSKSCICFNQSLEGACKEKRCCSSLSCTCVSEAKQCSSDCCQSESCVCFEEKAKEYSCEKGKCCESVSCTCTKTNGRSEEKCCLSESCLCVQNRRSSECCQSSSCICMPTKKSCHNGNECCGSSSCICAPKRECEHCGLMECRCEEYEARNSLFPTIEPLEPIMCDRTPNTAKTWKDIELADDFAFKTNKRETVCGASPIFYKKLIQSSQK
ncbi:hypothetical protein ACOME3_002506 [Neoechinorhynchus agilis]